MSRTVLVTIHDARPEALHVASQFVERMDAEGISVRVPDEDGKVFAAAGIAGLETVAAVEGAAQGCETAVVFGGDGTLLRSAELCRGSDTPIVGVNLGHVGFLAEAEAEDIDSVADRVIAADYAIEERLTLDVDVRVEGKIVAHNWALNEASVEKAARERMLEVVAEIDERPVSRWGCDGVVCATPTGSTAYNFSAGGPIVWPDVDALLMVPLSAHALFARPVVVSPQTRLAIEVIGRNTGVLWCDGRRAAELPIGARVEIRRGTEPVLLARLHQGPFTDRLVRKFDLPIAGWRGKQED